MKAGKARARRTGVAILGIAFAAALVASPAGAATATYSNRDFIQIPATGDGGTGDAAKSDPYPSNLEVSGLPGQLTDITVKLDRFLHNFPDDTGTVLAAPGGQALQLMGCAGGSDAASAFLTFRDDAAAPVPDEAPFFGGTYRPANYCPSLQDFPAPGPGTAYANPGPAVGGTATLGGTFGGASPNGTWSLFIGDFASSDLGALGGGWQLVLTTNQPPDTQITTTPPKKTKKKAATFEFGSSVPGATFLCSHNGAPPTPCTSPLTVQAAKGKNTFSVAARDEAGEADPTAATYDWKRKKKKR